MICPKCKGNLPTRNMFVQSVTMSKAKSPRLVITEYKIKHCPNCGQDVYFENTKMYAQKG